MLLEDFLNGNVESTCPFQIEDHFEIQNTTEFFNVNGENYSLKDSILEIINKTNKQVVFFLNEVKESDNYEILNTDKCMVILIQQTEDDN